MTDLELCVDILPRVSRTFALSIEALPEPLRATVRVSYLLCRIVDTVEDDETLTDERRLWLFEEFLGLLRDDGADPTAFEAAYEGRDGSDDLRLCRNAGAAFRELRRLPPRLADAARPHVAEMAEGMKEYSERWRGPGELTVLRDVADLERYCYYVAGTVGKLLTAVFVAVEQGLAPTTREGLLARAVGFGLGLQMTNIVKDVTADRARGWCFLPDELCRRHGVRPSELLEPGQRPRAMAVVSDVVDLAREHLGQALEYTLLVPPSARDVRLFVLVPLVLALATLEVVRGSEDVLVPGRAVKVSRATVAEALGESLRVVEDDDAIRELCGRAARLELGRPAVDRE